MGFCDLGVFCAAAVTLRLRMLQGETHEILQARGVVQPWDVQALQHAALRPLWRQKLQVPLLPHWSGCRCMTYTLLLSFYERNDVVGARMLYYIAVLYCFAVFVTRFVTFPWISKHAMHITILAARLAGLQNLNMRESNRSSWKGLLYVKTWGGTTPSPLGLKRIERYKWYNEIQVTHHL